MAKSFIPAIRKSLDFLDNTKIRFVIASLLIIYSAFISIQHNYSTLFNNPIVRLFFLLIIVIVAMKDITLALLFTIAMLISINYKPASATYEGMTLNCTPVDGSNNGIGSEGMDSEGNEGFEPDSEMAEGFNTPSGTSAPLPSNVPAKTTPSPVTQTPAPSNVTTASSQPAPANTGAKTTPLPTQVNPVKSMPTPMTHTAPVITTAGNVVSPSAPAQAKPAQPAVGGNNTTTSITKKITEMFSSKNSKKNRMMSTHQRVHNAKKMKEHFSVDGFLMDDESPAEYNSSTNCIQVLQNKSGNNLRLSSQCGAVATFQDELNAQGMIELPMGYHNMGNWGSFN